jgi:hypothetical protein
MIYQTVHNIAPCLFAAPDLLAVALDTRVEVVALAVLVVTETDAIFFSALKTFTVPVPPQMESLFPVQGVLQLD